MQIVSRLGARLEDAIWTAELRATAQRFAILQFLARSPYTCHGDEESGVVREMAAEGRAARFDVNLDRHRHFVCDRLRGLCERRRREAVE
jgi:Fe2+ or Zn2+ uptake regulation protein